MSLSNMPRKGAEQPPERQPEQHVVEYLALVVGPFPTAREALAWILARDVAAVNLGPVRLRDRLRPYVEGEKTIAPSEVTG